MDSDKVKLVVTGMTCTNCALTVRKTLEKNGANDIDVNYLTGDVSFSEVQNEKVPGIVTAINQLGYHVASTEMPGEEEMHAGHGHHHDAHRSPLKSRFIVSALFTLPLLLHMVLPLPWMHEPVFQLIFSLPVMFIGMKQFGRSAFQSVRSGIPNMDVLIVIGSSAAFIYSIFGLIYFESDQHSNFLFFETAATIITLVLLGNLIEENSVRQTTSAIADLQKLQPMVAKKVEADGKTSEVNVSELKKEDMVLVNSGDKVPIDGKIISGTAILNESMITGESLPVRKSSGDQVTGGTINETGSFKMAVARTGKDTTLSRIIELVKNAQKQRPAIQKLGDKISAIFVPVVVGISVITFLVSYFFISIPLKEAIMHSIAVLVISCPCAMGLATPTAVMAGIGRAAGKGILIKGGSTLEELSRIKTFVFDKTGTLTTGRFKIDKINCPEKDLPKVKSILFSMEQHSSHPIALSIVRELRPENPSLINWTWIEEDKGTGINATDEKGTLYSAGSFRMVSHLPSSGEHDLYILKDNVIIGSVDLSDELKTDAAQVISRIKDAGIRTVLLSGDRKEITEKVGALCGIDEIYSNKKPDEKLQVLEELMKGGPVAMIGDGVNDAPALAKATVGISISDATDTAIQSSQIILLSRQQLGILLPALEIGKLTYSTIRQNLFWAFFYNVIAIPIAAAGFLNPMIAALSMAFSDVVVIGNSLRLKYRKLNSLNVKR